MCVFSYVTQIQPIANFLDDAWCLRTPYFIISVAGGAKNYDVPIGVEEAFQSSLVAAASETSKN